MVTIFHKAAQTHMMKANNAPPTPPSFTFVGCVYSPNLALVAPGTFRTGLFDKKNSFVSCVLTHSSYFSCARQKILARLTGKGTITGTRYYFPS